MPERPPPWVLSSAEAETPPVSADIESLGHLDRGKLPGFEEPHGWHAPTASIAVARPHAIQMHRNSLGALSPESGLCFARKSQGAGRGREGNL